MKIAIIGYGKMGQAIEKIAKIKKHTIVFKKSRTPNKKEIQEIDVAIEFSTYKSVINNLSFCLQNNKPIVCGTTGWLHKINLIKNLCKNKKGSIVYSPNFSIGVNILFKINNVLSKIMNSYKEYEIEIEEIHHMQKKDKPSGTAIEIADKSIKNLKNKNKWTLDVKTYMKNEIPIISKRMDNIIGVHIVRYKSIIDNIEIKHIANNRLGFALGSVIAAEWLFNNNKPGFFSMQDVLNI